VDPEHISAELARNLVNEQFPGWSSLQRVDPRGGPTPGTHNYFRGASVRLYCDETVATIQTLGAEIDRAGAESAWAAATASTWTQRARWFHGDVSAHNLLTRNGRLSAATIRTARSRSSGGYLLDEPPDMTPTFPRSGVSGHAGAVQISVSSARW